MMWQIVHEPPYLCQKLPVVCLYAVWALAFPREARKVSPVGLWSCPRRLLENLIGAPKLLKFLRGLFSVIWILIRMPAIRFLCER